MEPMPHRGLTVLANSELITRLRYRLGIQHPVITAFVFNASKFDQNRNTDVKANFNKMSSVGWKLAQNFVHCSGVVVTEK
jgi:hypothetical protein